MATAWMPTNQIARRKADKIPVGIWDQHRPELENQYLLGGKRNGIALALRWIQTQNVPDFSPT